MGRFHTRLPARNNAVNMRKTVDIKIEKERLTADDAARWLKEHANDAPDEAAEAKWLRMARLQRERVAKRNARTAETELLE